MEKQTKQLLLLGHLRQGRETLCYSDLKLMFLDITNYIPSIKWVKERFM